MDYIRNLVDRVRRLELQNRVAKLEQLQAKLAGLAARERAQEIIDQANAMKNAAAPFFIPVTVPPVVDQSSAGVQTPTVNPFPQSPMRSSSSVPRPSSSSTQMSSSGSSLSSTGTSPQLVSLYENLNHFPSPLLIETDESRKLGHSKSGNGHSKSGKSHPKPNGVDDAAEALFEVGRASELEPETRQNAMLAFAELVASAVRDGEKQ